MKDLNDPDEKKQKAARDKLDKELGKDLRQTIEEGQKKQKAELDKLQKDARSEDRATREAAEKRLQELQDQARKQAEKDGKGTELTKEEMKDLVEKARDLNSKDDDKRKAAEKALDDKLGKQTREKIQEEMKKQDGPPDAQAQEDLAKKLNELAKDDPGRGNELAEMLRKHGGGDPTVPPKGPMEDDPRNRAKTAQLQLEDFEKNRYNRDLLDRLKWDDEKYMEFLEAQRERVEQLQKEADAFEQAQREGPKGPKGGPSIKLAEGGKVEARDSGAKVEGSGTRSFVAPPGFENARPAFIQPKSKR